MVGVDPVNADEPVDHMHYLEEEDVYESEDELLGRIDDPLPNDDDGVNIHVHVAEVDYVVAEDHAEVDNVIGEDPVEVDDVIAEYPAEVDDIMAEDPAEAGIDNAVDEDFDGDAGILFCLTTVIKHKVRVATHIKHKVVYYSRLFYPGNSIYYFKNIKNTLTVNTCR